MPVERIVKYFQGNGFDIDKATAHGLLAKTAELFDNLYKALRKSVKEGKYLHCDETYHTVLIKEGKGSKKGYIWVIVNAQTGLTYFFYDDGSRSEKVILNELDDIKAIADYDDVEWDNNRLERVSRYVSLSRHSSLFFGSHTGAKRGCIFYSLAL